MNLLLLNISFVLEAVKEFVLKTEPFVVIRLVKLLLEISAEIVMFISTKDFVYTLINVLFVNLNYLTVEPVHKSPICIALFLMF